MKFNIYETINGIHALKHFKFSNKHENGWQHKRHLFYRPECQEPTREPRKYYAIQMNEVSNLENEEEEEKNWIKYQKFEDGIQILRIAWLNARKDTPIVGPSLDAMM